MHLPIYTDASTPVDREPPRQHDENCSACSLGVGAAVRPVGKRGGILMLGQSPSKRCSDVGRPWVTTSERKLASIVQRIVGDHTPLAFDYAVRCSGGHPDDAVSACRGLTVQTMSVVQPSKIFAFGTAAAKSLVGTSAPHNVRRCWQRLEDGTLVFFFPEPFRTQANRVLAGWLHDDLKWAAAVDPGTLTEPDLFDFEMVDDLERARALAAEHDGAELAFDVETYGVIGEADFKIVSLSLTPLGGDLSYVWPEESMVHPDPRRDVLIGLLRSAKLFAHNAKYESRSCSVFFGEDLRHALVGDTMVWAKQLRADGAGGLDPLAWQVGMGGHKREAALHLDNAITILRVLRREADKPVPLKVETVERISPTTGKKQRRKVVVSTRPPTPAERRAQVIEAWSRTRASGGLQTNLAARVATPGKVIRPLTRRLTTNAGTVQHTIHVPAYPEPRTDVPISKEWLHAALVTGNERIYVYGLIDRDVCHRYNARDTAATALLAMQQRPLIEASEPYSKVWHSHLGKAPWAVGKVEEWGMLVDRDKLGAAEQFFTTRADELLTEIHEVSPGINPGSPDHVAELLFKALKLKPLKVSETTGKPSVNKAVLAALADAHPVIPKIREWKSLVKLDGTYAKGLAPFIRADGRIRANLHITGTETGRMSCSQPNLQTIPTRSEYAKMVKGVFIAMRGFKLVQIDYKALEVRIAAMLSGDRALLDVFERGGDPHRETAVALSQALWGTDFADCGGLVGDALTGEQGRRRGVCKNIVFGTIYGQGPAALAGLTGLTEPEAERAQDLIMGHYKTLKRWIEKTSQASSRSGETWTWWQGGPARCRPVPDIGEPDQGKAGHGKRQSYNTPVQGTGSEFCLASLVRCVEWLIDVVGQGCKLIMSVHDSLVFEVPEHLVDMVVEGAVRIMTGWPSGAVKVEVDVEVGDSWGAMEAYTPPAATA